MSISPENLVYVAGQACMDSNGNLVGKDDAGAQTRQALKNIGVVLAGAGADFSNVVEFTTYVVARSSIPGGTSTAGANSIRICIHTATSRPTPCTWWRAWCAKIIWLR